METTSKRLKKYLELNDLKQIDLVEITGLGKSAISQYLSGKIIPKQDKIYLLSEKLHVNPAWLMGYDVPMEGNTLTTIAQSKITLSKFETTLLGTCKKLNDTGKKEALKRVEELTYIDRYKNAKPIISCSAAHNDAEITEEEYNNMQKDFEELMKD